MSEDQLSLLSAIIASPEDLGIRGMYADACDEAGQTYHAALIRAQFKSGHTHYLECLNWDKESWRWTNKPSGWNAPDVGNNHTYVASWLPAPIVGCRLTIVAGFVEEVRGSWDSWVKFSEDAYWNPSSLVRCPPTAHPIRKVVLTDRPSLRNMRHNYIGERRGEVHEIERMIAGGMSSEEVWHRVIFPEHWPGIEFESDGNGGTQDED